MRESCRPHKPAEQEIFEDLDCLSISAHMLMAAHAVAHEAVDRA